MPSHEPQHKLRYTKPCGFLYPNMAEVSISAAIRINQSIKDYALVVVKWFVRCILLWQPDDVIKAAISICVYIGEFMQLLVPYLERFTLQPLKYLFACAILL
jgi:hypothetical protein